MMISGDQRAVDEATSWLRRIIITWFAYITVILLRQYFAAMLLTNIIYVI